MKVGDLVKSKANGAGAGVRWVLPGTIGIVTEILEGPGGSAYPARVKIRLSYRGQQICAAYHAADWAVISESR